MAGDGEGSCIPGIPVDVEKARELTLGERDFLKELANLVEKTLKANTQLTSN